MRIVIDWKRQRRDVAILAGLGVFMALLSPFGSVSDVSFLTALLYWVPLMIWGGLAGEGLARLLRKVAPSLPLAPHIVVLSLLMTMVVLPAVLLQQAIILREPASLGDYPLFAFYVWLISVSVTAAVILGHRAFGLRYAAFDTASSLPTAPAPAGPGPFLDRLPVRLRTAELYAIESEDHYLRVHTSAGQELILMRLADAVRELAGVEGLQTHRSWWVAKQGLADVARGNGRLVLKLKSGAEAPVSRTYAKAVKDAGWN